MRKTNLNTPIKRADLKSGDKIRIVREVTLKDVRQTTLGNNVKAAIITTDQGAESVTLAITEAETVTLLERDVKIDIPKSAVIVYWQEDGEDYYARYDSDRQSWIEDDGEEYETTEDLAERIEEYIKEDTFEVLKRRPLFSEGGFAQGGVVPGRSHHGLGFDPGTINALARNTLSRNVVA